MKLPNLSDRLVAGYRKLATDGYWPKLLRCFHKVLALAELGMRELGHQKVFENWLTTPKIALEGKRPIEVINTDEGYSKVMKLLRKINE